MLRWLFHIFAALSLLLFIITVFYFIRSQIHIDHVHYSVDKEPKASLSVFADGPRLKLFYYREMGYDTEWDNPIKWYSNPVDHDDPLQGCIRPDLVEAGELIAAGRLKDCSYWSFIGFTYAWFGHTAVFHVRFMEMILMTTLLPAHWLLTYRKRRRRYRHKRGLCIRCGYDLQATPTACPECGHTP